MQTVLFHSTIFGPIKSRRLGVSLGINLMPNDGKICSFDCLYCEAGFNAQGPGKDGIPTREAVKKGLKRKLEAMHAAGEPLDVITFSGNGEPTVHPLFLDIVKDVMRLRDTYYPEAKVSVLTNSTMAGKPHVAEALKLVDNNIVKLDSALAATFRLVNRPSSPNVIPEGVIEDLKQFAGQCVVQTMMLRGEWEGHRFDNTTEAEVDALINAYKAIQPREVMLYSIDRKTPAETLTKVTAEELETIAQRMQAAGFKVQVNA
ncbi:radical SAM protein [Sodaliphilus sp.]|uniref:radical SAM protein n=1 Tax=Sodaliphilus sp. TaxID=2815818 RepID=UPI00388DA979